MSGKSLQGELTLTQPGGFLLPGIFTLAPGPATLPKYCANANEKRADKMKDLSEKIESGELEYKTPTWYWIACFMFGILCFLPIISKLPASAQSSLEPLSSFSAQLSTIRFPSSTTYPSIITLIASIFLSAWSTYFRVKKGGLNSEDNTIILLKDGPYNMIRHPTEFAFTVFLVTIPICLSKYVPFTILSIIGCVIIIASTYYLNVKEEKLNLRKWGDEYRQYMKDVPRWNIIKGLWNFRKF